MIKKFSILSVGLLIAAAGFYAISYAQNDGYIPWWLKNLPRGVDYNALREAEDGIEDKVVKAEIEKYKSYIGELQSRVEDEKDKQALAAVMNRLVEREKLRASEDREDAIRAEIAGREIERELDAIIKNFRTSAPSKQEKEVILSLTMFRYYELRDQAGVLADPLRIEMGTVKDRSVMKEYLEGIKKKLEAAKNTVIPPAYTGFFPKPPEWARGLVPRRFYESAEYKKYKELIESIERTEALVGALQEAVEKGVNSESFWPYIYGRLLELNVALDIGSLENGLYPQIFNYPQSEKAAEELRGAGIDVRMLLFHLPTTYADIDEWPYYTVPSTIAELRKENEELARRIEEKQEELARIQELLLEEQKKVDEIDESNDELEKEIQKIDMKNKRKKATLE